MCVGGGVAGEHNGVRLVGGLGPPGKLEVALKEIGSKPVSYRPVCESGGTRLPTYESTAAARGRVCRA